jgi:hypothetical protein
LPVDTDQWLARIKRRRFLAIALGIAGVLAGVLGWTKNIFEGAKTLWDAAEGYSSSRVQRRIELRLAYELGAVSGHIAYFQNRKSTYTDSWLEDAAYHAKLLKLQVDISRLDFGINVPITVLGVTAFNWDTSPGFKELSEMLEIVAGEPCSEAFAVGFIHSVASHVAFEDPSATSNFSYPYYVTDVAKRLDEHLSNLHLQPFFLRKLTGDVVKDASLANSAFLDLDFDKYMLKALKDRY